MRPYHSISHLCDCSVILIILPCLILCINPNGVNNIMNNVLTHLNYVMDVLYTVENVTAVLKILKGFVDLQS